MQKKSKSNSLSCRVLVFLVFLHQEEDSVQGRARFPRRTRRRCVQIKQALIKKRQFSNLESLFFCILDELLKVVPESCSLRGKG